MVYYPVKHSCLYSKICHMVLCIARLCLVFRSCYAILCFVTMLYVELYDYQLHHTILRYVTKFYVVSQFCVVSQSCMVCDPVWCCVTWSCFVELFCCVGRILAEANRHVLPNRACRGLGRQEPVLVWFGHGPDRGCRVNWSAAPATRLWRPVPSRPGARPQGRVSTTSPVSACRVAFDVSLLSSNECLIDILLVMLCVLDLWLTVHSNTNYVTLFREWIDDL